MRSIILWVVTCALLVSAFNGYCAENQPEQTPAATPSDQTISMQAPGQEALPGAGTPETQSPDQPTSTQGADQPVAAPEALASEAPAPAVQEEVPAVKESEVAQPSVPDQPTEPAPLEPPSVPVASEPAPVQEATPAAPKAVSAQAPEQPSPEAAQEQPILEGIDTMGSEEPKGNWLLKRRWWERAQNLYDKIRQQIDQIFEIRMTFFTQKAEIDKTLFTNFYREIGLELGQMQEVLKDLLSKLDQEQVRQGSLTETERDLLRKVTDERTNLEQLQRDIDMIVQLDSALQDTLQKMMDQINNARSYERQAWNNFKNITESLSDLKAKELYYRMNSEYQNIKDIFSYITGALAGHFNTLAQKAQEQVTQIKEAIAQLDQKGINLEQQARELEEQDLRALQDLPKGKTAPEPEVEPEQQGFLSKIVHTILIPFKFIWQTIKSISASIFSVFSRKDTSSDEDKQSQEGEMRDQTALSIHYKPTHATT